MRISSIIKRFNYLVATFLFVATSTAMSLVPVYADPPGNNGTLQVHEQGSADYKKSNEPHVCTFNFEAFDLDANQTGNVLITKQAPTQTAGDLVLTLNLSTDAQGNGDTLYVNDSTQTPAYSLPDGHYKATLDNKFGTDPGNKAKSKVFWVTCNVTPAQPTIETQVSASPVTVGDTVTDTATVTGTDANGSVNGTVAFYLCGPDDNAPPDCSTDGSGSQVGTAVALADAGTTPPSSTAVSDSYTVQSPGNYCFRAVYAPNADDNSYLTASHTNLTTECFVAKPAPVYGSITIEKNAIPDSSQTFHFTTTGLSTDATGFNLIDDSTAGLPQQVFSSLGAGTYTVSETATSGWDFAGLTCDNDGAVVTTNGSAVSITLSGAQNVVCTYTNRERGTITVNKVTIPANDPTGFPISLATTTAGATVTENPSQTLTTSTPVVYHVSQGTYSVAEDLSNLPSWQTTGNTCSSVTVSSANLNAICTITNTKYTSLSGTKWEVNADGSTVGQTGLSGWVINLYKDGTATGQTATTGNDGSYSFNNLVDDGNYTVTETLVAGWTQICAPLAVSHCATGANDFGNFKNASITGYKWNDENGDQKHQKSEPKLAGWTIFIDANGNNRLDSGEVSAVTDGNGDYSFDNLAPGKYRLCEVQQAGWVQTYPGTASGCSTVTVKTSGKTYHKNFGNTVKPQTPPTAAITIVKDAQPNSSQAFSFTTNANQSGAFSLTDDGTGASSSITFANLPLREGAYTFSEDQVNGWQLSSVQCNTEDNWGVDGGVLYVFPNVNQANVTCVFTNVAQPATLTIVKKAYPFGTSQAFTFDVSSVAEEDRLLRASTLVKSFQLDDNNDPALSNTNTMNLSAGTYTVTEESTPGWNLADIECGSARVSVSGATVTVSLAAGQQVTCTYTNQQPVVPQVLGESTATSGQMLANTGAEIAVPTVLAISLILTASGVMIGGRMQRKRATSGSNR